MEKNRKEREGREAQERHDAENRRLAAEVKQLRQQLKKNIPQSSESKPPRKRRSTSQYREKQVNAIFNMWILPPTTSDFLKYTVQAERIRANVGDNLWERFKSQSLRPSFARL
jgi:hypothetical protein